MTQALDIERHPRNPSDLYAEQFPALLPFLGNEQWSAAEEGAEVGRFFAQLGLERQVIAAELVWGGQCLTAELRARRSEGRVVSLELSLPAARREGIKNGPFPATVIIRRFGQLRFFCLPAVDCSKPLFLPLPERLYILHRRRDERRAIGRGQVLAEVQTAAGRPLFQAELCQFSGRGLALRVAALPSDIPQREPWWLELSWGEGQRAKVSGEVVQISPPAAGDEHWRIGLRLISCGEGTAYAGLLGYLQKLIYPQGLRVSRQEDWEAAWQLLSKAVSPSDRSQPGQHLAVWRRTQSLPRPLHQVFLWRRQNQPQATVSVSRIYSRTWLFHSLGTAESGAGQPPVELLRYADELLRWTVEEGFGCFLWPSRDRFWQRYGNGFVQTAAGPGAQIFEEFQPLRLSVGAVLAGRRPPRRERVWRMQPADQAEVLALLRRQCDPLYLEATDWRPGNLRLEELQAPHRRAALPRKREVVVLRRNGVLQAVAVCEYSALARSFFGLFNAFRLYWAAGAEAPEVEQEKMRDLLLEGVFAFYRRQGASQCFWQVAEPPASIRRHPHFQEQLPTLGLWIFQRHRFQTFLQHLERGRWESGLRQRQSDSDGEILRPLLGAQPRPFYPRRSVRGELPADSGPIPAALINPEGAHWPARVCDLDSYGCQLALPHNLSLMAQQPLQLHLTLNGSGPMAVSGVIRHQRVRLEPGWQRSETVLGMEFSGGQETQQARLHDFVYRRLNPAVVSFQPADYGRLTELLQRVNYFDYYQPTDTRRLIDSAEVTYAQLPRLAPDLARVTLLGDGPRMIGSHAFYRLNPRTWHLHQLAVDTSAVLSGNKLPTRLILQSSFQYLGLDPGAQFFVTYFHDQAPIAKVYFEAGRNHTRPQDYQFFPLQMMLLQLTRRRPVNIPGDIICREAGNEECQTIAAALRAQLTPLEFEALALGDLPLDSFVSQWVQRGLERRRQVLVAHVAGVAPQACAVINLGPPGINVIGFHDNVRIFYLDDTERRRADLQAALLAQIGEFFLTHGRNQVYWEAEVGQSGDRCPWSCADGGKNWRLVANRHCCMTALQFFLARYGKLEERLSGSS